MRIFSHSVSGTIPLLALLSLLAAPIRGMELPEISLTEKDRILILAPHPDDEVLGCGGVLQSVVKKKLPVRVVFFTNGDNYEWAFLVYKKRLVLNPASVINMGRQRRQEALAAGSLLGMESEDYRFLGYPDWGTETLWIRHWGASRPALQAMLTRARAVPYESALRPGAPYKGESVLSDLESVIQEFQPTKIFVSHPADGHRDHRALFLFTQVALWQLEPGIRPEVFPFLIHHPGWPRPRGFVVGRQMTPPEGLNGIAWARHSLTGDEMARKLFALHAHQTQMSSDRHYLLSFIGDSELFGNFQPLRLTSQVTPVHSLSAKSPSDVPESVPGTVQDAAWRDLKREGNDLVINVEFVKRRLATIPKAQLGFFGYRQDRSFADMPKIWLTLTKGRLEIRDQARLLNPKQVRVAWSGNTVALKIPLALLGQPDRMIATQWSRDAEGPFDDRVWRIVEF